ncbi:MAG: ABC transporter substrate-binding protein [Burkholderiales bacterium]|nr:ABC transporter substrate-binding protein [Burkholderiales bacterium]
MRRSTRRRLLLGAAGLLAGLSPRIGPAQKKPKAAVIGWLVTGSMSSQGPGRNLAAFREGMAALGWKEGVDYVIEARSAESRPERHHDLARELAALRPALMVAGSLQVAQVLASSAPGIPIVMAGGSNPVAARLAASYARPGGMVTGITTLPTELAEKLLELLVAIEPGVKRVGVLVPFNTRKEPSKGPLDAARRSAARYKVEAHIAHPTTWEEIERDVQGFSALGAQALIVMASPLLSTERTRILRLAQAQRWPVVAQTTPWVEDGALLSYSAASPAHYRRAAWYADRILKGAKPGDLPIEQPREFEIALNLRTAKALGITLPQSILLQATRVIE